MYQTEICLAFLGIIAICGVIGIIYNQMYMNYLVHDDWRKDWRKDYRE